MVASGDKRTDKILVNIYYPNYNYNISLEFTIFDIIWWQILTVLFILGYQLFQYLENFVRI